MNTISRSIACIITCLATSAYGQIPWVSDPNQAMKMAQQTGKPVLLHFYTDSCAPCKMLEYRAFRDPEFVKAVTDLVIPLKVNAEDHREFASDYAVTRWPTDVYLFPDGSEISRSVSPQDPGAYTELIQRVSVRCRDYLTELNSRTNPSKPAVENVADGKISAKAASHEMHPPVSHDRASHEPPKHTAREIPEISSSAPSHLAVASYRKNANDTSDSSERQSDAENKVDKQRTNRYRSQSANFAGSMASTSQSGPSQVLSPFVKQPMPRQESPAPAQQSSPAPQRSLINQASNHAAPSVASGEVAMDGYCPILLDQKRWEPGNPQLAVRHRGKIYYCSSEQARDAFLADPDRYSPMLSGYDVVRFLENGQIVNGKREFGCWFGGRVYLFDSEETRRVFDLNIDRYLQQLQSLQASAGSAASEPNNDVYR